jgi:WhiB family redox-sensing transcriptional regulator
MDRALCAEVDPDLFFPSLESLWKVAASKKVCGECSVASECLAYAIDNRFDDGIYGGTTPSERREIIRKGKAKR